jgi:hypothetical protein
LAGLAVAGGLLSLPADVEQMPGQQAVPVVESSTIVVAAAQQPDWYVRT